MVKSKIDIIKLVKSYGFDVEMKGTNYFCLCPFHPDKSPSLCLYPETNSFYCFSCNTGGPIEKFVAKVENISSREAIKRIYGENYEFNKLRNDIDTVELDKKYMLDRLAVKIKNRAYKHPEFVEHIPSLVSKILYQDIDLLKFNSIIKGLDKAE